MAILFHDDTPIERYCLPKRPVYVKRDDLYAGLPAPPLAKLRGAMTLLARLYSEGIRLVGCWDTRISALGQGIVACCTTFPGMNAVVAYPKTKGSDEPTSIAKARELGGEVLPVVAGRITISFAAARREVVRRGGAMLPFGLECPETVASVARAAATVPPNFTSGGTVVVSAGSGVTLAGLVHGLRGRPSRFLGVSSGRSVDSIQRCLNRYGIQKSRYIRIVPAREAYYVPIDYECPFPSHPHYDRKAWRYLSENVKCLEAPLFFWNIGA